jgi:hypothetical protein
MKKYTLTILTFILVLFLVGCAGANEESASDASVGKPDTSAGVSAEDTANVPNTNVHEYPNSEMVYSSKNEIVYATSDPGAAVNDFYTNHPNLKKVRGTGGQEGYDFYTTPLTDLMRGIGTDLDKHQDKLDEINAYIDESGGLHGLAIYDANVDAQFKEDTLGSIFSELPLDKTLILYTLINEL